VQIDYIVNFVVASIFGARNCAVFGVVNLIVFRFAGGNQWVKVSTCTTSIYNNSLLSIHAPVDEHVGRTNGAVGAGSQVTNIGIVGPARLVSVAKSISHVVLYD